MNARTTALSCLLIASLCAACGGSSDNGLNQAPADSGTPVNDAGTTDSGNVDPTDGSSDNDATTDAGTDSGGEPDPFAACEVTSECGSGEECVASVCIKTPRAVALLAEEIDTVNEDGTVTTEITERSDVPFNFDCYTDGTLYSTPEGPATATINGVVERFGSGPRTNGLCVSIYDETVLLPWLVDGGCSQIDSESNEEEYIACFQLDACRCDEYFNTEGAESLPEFDDIRAMLEGAEFAADAAGSPLTINSLDTCYEAIGNCVGIEDAAARSACEARVQAYSGDTSATSLVLGHVVAGPNPDGSEFASFSIPNIPTNTTFAFKVSGEEARWRDTWEYGLYSRADLVRDGAIRIDSNAVSDGTWNTIPPSVGFAGRIDDLNGAVAGAIRDCGVQGERVPFNVVHATAGFSFISPQTKLAYFNGNPNNRLPSQGIVDSNVDGLFAAINLPPGPNRVSTMVCTANCDGNGTPTYVAVGARNVFQTPKSVIIATFEGIVVPE